MITRRAFLAAVAAAPAARAQALTDADVLQAVLRIEHATIHGYGAVGPRLPLARREAARRWADVHRLHRDLLRAALADRGAVPEPAALAYPRPTPEADATAAAAGLERRALDAYRAGLPRLGEAALRGLLAQMLARSAEALTELTGQSSALP